MKCKYCGKEIANSGSLLVGKGSGGICSNSPTKKHVLANATGNKILHCKYCGKAVRNNGSLLVGAGLGGICPNSPNKKHRLN
ncbi:MAG: hypothetical protein FWG57_09130 [Endomicrobia bacterium]|nr:hypothetical protein [Endomicrobiia bacterium]